MTTVSGPSFAVESEEFARVLNNALAFCPARNVATDHILIGGEPGRVYAAGTDSYCAGWDSVEADNSTSWRIEVHREHAALLERHARMDKKGTGEGRLDNLLPVRSLTFVGGMDGGEPVTYGYRPPAHSDMWEVIEESLTPEQQFRVAFTPTYLSRFAKVKADKDERIIDVAIDGPDAPVLMKIGPTFRGLIAPVNRPRHAELIGAESLWEDQ